LNYFVTGATGFVGRHLVAELLKREGTIHVLVREGSRGKVDALRDRLGAGDRIQPVSGDLAKPGLGVEGFDEPIDHFFHLAAIYDVAADGEASGSRSRARCSISSAISRPGTPSRISGSCT
jgi:thioester reductase-like protein